MSYERMCETEGKLEAEISCLKQTAQKLLEKAEQVDAEEDARYGKGKRGDELPEELRRRESRLKAIRKAKAALEAEAKERAVAAAGTKNQEPHREPQAEETVKNEDEPRVSERHDVRPAPKAQRNFTDPDSRIMLDGASKAFEQAYNTQLAVDSDFQVILAASVTQQANDVHQLVPMLELVQAKTGAMPDIASADAGYFSESNVLDERLSEVQLYIPPDRLKHGQVPVQANPRSLTVTVLTIAALLFVPIRARRVPRQLRQTHTHGFLLAYAATVIPLPASSLLVAGVPTIRESMRYKLRTPSGKTVYGKRKTTVEPVFGQIKQCRGFRRFSFRGFGNVFHEWRFVAAIHNLLKLFKFRGADMAFVN